LAELPKTIQRPWFLSPWLGKDWAASRPLLLTLHFFLGGEGSDFLANFSAISAYSTSSFYI